MEVGLAVEEVEEPLVVEELGIPLLGLVVSEVVAQRHQQHVAAEEPGLLPVLVQEQGGSAAGEAAGPAEALGAGSRAGPAGSRPSASPPSSGRTPPGPLILTTTSSHARLQLVASVPTAVLTLDATRNKSNGAARDCPAHTEDVPTPWAFPAGSATPASLTLLNCFSVESAQGQLHEHPICQGPLEGARGPEEDTGVRVGGPAEAAGPPPPEPARFFHGSRVPFQGHVWQPHCHPTALSATVFSRHVTQ